MSCVRSHSRCDFSERMANKGSCRLVQRFVTASILGETRVERVEKLDTGCGWVVIWQAVFRTACRIIAKLHWHIVTIGHAKCSSVPATVKMSHHDSRSCWRQSKLPIHIPHPPLPCCCQDMSPIKPLALRWALSGLIIKRFAHLIASVYRPLNEHENEFPFAAGHLRGCRVSCVMCLFVALNAVVIPDSHSPLGRR